MKKLFYEKWLLKCFIIFFQTNFVFNVLADDESASSSKSALLFINENKHLKNVEIRTVATTITFKSVSDSNKLPIFLREPMDTFMIKSAPAKLVCRVISALEIYFQCNSEIIHPSQKSGNILDKQSGVRYIEASVLIERDRVEEFFGDFHCACVATSAQGSIVSRNALVTHAYIRREFEVPPYSQSSVLGSQVELRCHPPKGRPAPQVSWLKNGIVLDPAAESNVLLSGEGHLIIVSMSHNDEANYSCVAENIAGKRIHEPPALLTIQPSDGWSEWSEWTGCSCSSRSGQFERRSRHCGIAAHLKCHSGPSKQRRPCGDLNGRCNSGRWQPWSAWSVCNPDCSRHRSRSCILGRNKKYCKGPDFGWEACKKDFCGVQSEFDDTKSALEELEAVSFSPRHKTSSNSISLYVGLTVTILVIAVIVFLVILIIRKMKQTRQLPLTSFGIRQHDVKRNGGTKHRSGGSHIGYRLAIADSDHNPTSYAKMFGSVSEDEKTCRNYMKTENQSSGKFFSFKSYQKEKGLPISSSAALPSFPSINSASCYQTLSVPPQLPDYQYKSVTDTEKMFKINVSEDGYSQPINSPSNYLCSCNQHERFLGLGVSEADESLIDDYYNDHHHYEMPLNVGQQSDLTKRLISDSRSSESSSDAVPLRHASNNTTTTATSSSSSSLSFEAEMRRSVKGRFNAFPLVNHDSGSCSQKVLSDSKTSRISSVTFSSPNLPSKSNDGTSATVWSRISSDGTRIVVPNMGIFLSIVPESVYQFTEIDIFVTVIRPDTKFMCDDQDEVCLISPRIFIGPPTALAKLLKPIVISFSHCACDKNLNIFQADNDNIWRKIVAVRDAKTWNIPCYTHLEERTCHIVTSTISSLALFESFSCRFQEDVKKRRLRMVAYGGSGTKNAVEFSIKVYFIPDTEEWAFYLSQYEKDNYKLAQSTSFVMEYISESVLNLEIENLTSSWCESNANYAACQNIPVNQIIWKHQGGGEIQLNFYSILLSASQKPNPLSFQICLTSNSQEKLANMFINTAITATVFECNNIFNIKKKFKLNGPTMYIICKMLDTPGESDWHQLARRLNLQQYPFFSNLASPTEAILVLWEAINDTKEDIFDVIREMGRKDIIEAIEANTKDL